MLNKNEETMMDVEVEVSGNLRLYAENPELASACSIRNAEELEAEEKRDNPHFQDELEEVIYNLSLFVMEYDFTLTPVSFDMSNLYSFMDAGSIQELDEAYLRVRPTLPTGVRHDAERYYALRKRQLA